MIRQQLLFAIKYVNKRLSGLTTVVNFDGFEKCLR